MLHCAGCSTEAASYSNIEELEIHIASDHVNYVPFECEKCRFSRFPTEFALHSHCTNDHGLKEFYIKYKVTPETGHKRQLVKDLLQKSLNISDLATARNMKRKRESAIEVVQSSTSPAMSPCGSQDSEDSHRVCETVKPIKAEVDCIPSKPSGEKDLGQHVVVAATGEITLNNNYPNYAGLGDVFHNDSSSLFDINLQGLDTMNDISKTIYPTEGAQSSSVAAAKRKRPPRTCTECGLQVTGQRSSLVYHANSKHLRMPLFYCRPCNKTWTTVTKSDVLKHVKAVHGGDESCVVDYRSQYGYKIREMTDKCFPPRQRGSANEEEDLEGNIAENGLTNPEAETWIVHETSPSNVPV